MTILSEYIMQCCDHKKCFFIRLRTTKKHSHCSTLCSPQSRCVSENLSLENQYPEPMGTCTHSSIYMNIKYTLLESHGLSIILDSRDMKNTYKLLFIKLAVASMPLTDWSILGCRKGVYALNFTSFTVTVYKWPESIFLEAMVMP